MAAPRSPDSEVLVARAISGEESQVLIARAVSGGEPQVLIARARRERSEADLAMVLASLSWIIGPIVLSLPGLLIARREIAGIRAGRRAESNLGKARNAYWISVLNLIVSFVFLAASAYMLPKI